MLCYILTLFFGHHLPLCVCKAVIFLISAVILWERACVVIRRNGGHWQRGGGAAVECRRRGCALCARRLGAAALARSAGLGYLALGTRRRYRCGSRGGRSRGGGSWSCASRRRRSSGRRTRARTRRLRGRCRRYRGRRGRPSLRLRAAAGAFPGRRSGRRCCCSGDSRVCSYAGDACIRRLGGLCACRSYRHVAVAAAEFWRPWRLFRPRSLVLGFLARARRRTILCRRRHGLLFRACR